MKLKVLKTFSIRYILFKAKLFTFAHFISPNLSKQYELFINIYREYFLVNPLYLYIDVRTTTKSDERPMRLCLFIKTR